MQIRSRRRSAEEQLQLIAECRASGLSIAEWCRREGVRPDTYYTWVERLQAKGKLEKAATVPQRVVQNPYVPDIVKVEVNQPVQIECSQNQPELTRHSMAIGSENMSICQHKAVMEITIHGICIKVTNQASPQLLAEVLQIIGGTIGC